MTDIPKEITNKELEERVTLLASTLNAVAEQLEDIYINMSHHDPHDILEDTMSFFNSAYMDCAKVSEKLNNFVEDSNKA